MTPQRPIELVNASKACADAWLKRDAMIEAGDKVGVLAMNTACAILEERYSTLYRQWQDAGGTSDIDSLAFLPQFVDAWCDEEVTEQLKSNQLKQYFGKVKVTTSKEWDRRHLHLTQEERDLAAVLRKQAGF